MVSLHVLVLYSAVADYTRAGCIVIGDIVGEGRGPLVDASYCIERDKNMQIRRVRILYDISNFYLLVFILRLGF